MTNLPAILIEAEALKYCKECVRFVHAESVRLIGFSWFSKEGSRYFSRQFLKQCAMMNPSAMSEMINCAMVGWHDAHEALGELIQEFLARGQQLPPQLATYDIHAWNMRLSSLRGRRKSDQATRNIADVLIIDAVCKHFPLRPTRNKGAKRPERLQSVAAILAQAHKEVLPAEFLKPTPRALEAMWENDGLRLLKFARHQQIPLPAPQL